jgi:hypothetical protein
VIARLGAILCRRCGIQDGASPVIVSGSIFLHFSYPPKKAQAIPANTASNKKTNHNHALLPPPNRSSHPRRLFSHQSRLPPLQILHLHGRLPTRQLRPGSRHPLPRLQLHLLRPHLGRRQHLRQQRHDSRRLLVLQGHLLRLQRVAFHATRLRGWRVYRVR